MNADYELKIEYLPIEKLKPYERNARKHTDTDVNAIANSIKKFGIKDPIGIWSKGQIIVEGHGRLLAAKKLGMEKVPVIRLDDLTDEERRAYALAHNKTAELSGWDFDALNAEISTLNTSVDLSDFGFHITLSDPETAKDETTAPQTSAKILDGKEFFDRIKNNDTSYEFKPNEESNEEYEQFVDKFKVKHTTDDCYTPEHIYGAVLRWACEEYDIAENHVVRPFYPGGDYEKYFYPDECVVIDNPPFSILRQIIRFYVERNIKFLLFAPALTLFTPIDGVCFLTVGFNTIYENGANVRTSFITNLETEYRAKTAPELYKMLAQADSEVNKTDKRVANQYPDNVITASKMMRLSANDIELNIPAEESVEISSLDDMKSQKKSLFGDALLVSDNIARQYRELDDIIRNKEKTIHDKNTYSLSDRELNIVKSLERR